MLFNERLKALRKKNKLTQSELSKKLNIKPVTISSYELGNSTPNNDMLIALSKIFDVSTDYLLGRTDDPSPLSKEEKRNLTIEEALDNVMTYDDKPVSDHDREVLRRLFETYLDTKKED
ncbi:helix-turn-helix domain-containing protein [Enterococcus nangangensis]